MTMPTLTRLRATMLGCGLAFTSCLMSTASHPTVPLKCAFELPPILGSWQLLKQESPAASELSILQATDHWQRVYQCQKTQKVVVATLIAGAAGPLASHQPEVCYARHEFCAHSDARIWTVPERRDSFRFQTLEPRQPTESALTIAYAWHDGTNWTAPGLPRFQLAGHASLQRLQLNMRHPGGLSRAAEVALRQFVQLILDAADAQATAQPNLITASF